MGVYFAASLPVPEIRARISGPYSLASTSWLPTGEGGPIHPLVALQDPSFYAACKAIAEPCGFLPIVVEGRPEIEYILNVEANRTMSAQAVREAITMQAITTGCGYAAIVGDPDTGLPSIYPLDASRIQSTEDDVGNPAYLIKGYSRDLALTSDQLMILPGLGLDGESGLSITNLGARTINLSLNAQKFASSFYSSGVMAGGVIESPASLSDDAYKRLKDSWRTAHSGLDNAHCVPILEEGASFKPNHLSPQDFEMAEGRRLSAVDNCRLVGVNPVHIGDLSHSTMNNVEQINRLHVLQSLRPWFRRWEICIIKYVLKSDRTAKVYVDFDEMTKADLKSRLESYVQGIQWGIYERQWVQKEEGLPIDVGGPRWFKPLNMEAIN